MNGNDPLEQPKVFASRSNLSSLMFIGSIIDFLRFTLNPVASEKVLSTDLRKNNYLVSPSSTSSVSSAYYITGKS